MKKYLMIIALIVAGTSVLAQQQGTKLDETVITTTEGFGSSLQDIAKNVYVVTSEEIAQKGAQDIGEALRGVPGIIINRMDGASPKIDIRGSGATAKNNTIILLDGIPLNGLIDFDINSIPIEQVAKIEVIEGGGAVIYGDGATGGVVNIITKNPENKLIYGNVGFEVGSWDTKRENLSIGTKVSDKLLLKAFYSGYSSKEYRSRYKDYKNDKDNREAVWLSGKYLLEKGNIELRYSHNEAKDYYTGYLEEKDFNKDPKQAGSYGGVTHYINDIWNLAYTQNLGKNLDFLIYGGYFRNKSKNLNQLTEEYFIKPQIKYTYGKDSYLIVGGDYRDGHRKFNDPVNVNGKIQKAPDDKRESYAGYVLNKITIGNWQFNQGYRNEKVKYKYSQKVYDNSWNLKEVIPMDKDYSNNNSYEFGVNYLYSTTGNIYANYTRGTRTPTIDDAGAWSGPVKTQKNNIYEIGVRDQYGITTVESSIFYIESENEIYYDKTDSNNSTNRNFDGKVKRKGAQISLHHYFEKLTLKENLSYIEAKVASGKYSGNQFAGVPKWTANVGATYNFTEQFLVNVDGYYQSKIYAEDDFDNYFSKGNEYITVDTNIKYKFESGLELYAGVRNLFDKKYANAITSTRSVFGDGPRKVYYPADGRSYYLGFNFNF